MKHLPHLFGSIGWTGNGLYEMREPFRGLVTDDMGKMLTACVTRCRLDYPVRHLISLFPQEIDQSLEYSLNFYKLIYNLVVDTVCALPLGFESVHVFFQTLGISLVLLQIPFRGHVKSRWRVLVHRVVSVWF